MKKTKKFLSILLSVLMIISALPMSAITAFADIGVGVVAFVDYYQDESAQSSAYYEQVWEDDYITLKTINNVNIVAPDGKDFDYWKIGNSSEKYYPGDTYLINGSIKVYAVWNDIGEGEKVTISFDANGGTGAMGDRFAIKDKSYTLPNCRFIAPTGKRFAGWNYLGNTYQAGCSVTVSDEVTLQAVWENAEGSVVSWADLQAAITTANQGDVIVLNNDCVAESTDTYINIPSGKKITIDLNGFSINRNLIQKTENGHVLNIEKDAELTIQDTSMAQTGVITGGCQSTAKKGNGIYNGGTLNLVSGNISHNTGSSSGGGVYCDYESLFKMTGGEISNNTTTTSGGGVYNAAGTFILEGGFITENSCNTNGGGVNNGVYQEPSTPNPNPDLPPIPGATHYGHFIMTGGTINRNSASSTGGGIEGNSYYELLGGVITENTVTALNNGGGVYLNTTNGKGYTFGGNIKIFNNYYSKTDQTKIENVYLYGADSKSVVHISQSTPLTNGASIYFHFLARNTKTGNKIVSDGAKSGDEQYFHYETSLWHPEYNDGKLVLQAGAEEPHKHTFDESTREIVIPATCTETGVDKLMCAVCNEYDTVQIEPLGHDMLPATCTEPKHCSRCDYTEGEPLGHDYSIQGELISEATCTKPATYKAICTRCDSVSGTIEIGEVDPTAHNWKNATCTAPKTCRLCGLTEGEALGHIFVINSRGVAKCKRCSATPPAMNYTHSTNVDSSEIRVGDIIKAGVVIRPYENYIDGNMALTVDGKYLGAYTPYKKYTVPQCLKCVSKSKMDNYGNFDIAFETACTYTEANCTTAGVCVYCGHIGEPAPHDYTMDVENNVYTYTCNTCGDVTVVDKNALLASIETAKNEYLNNEVIEKKYITVFGLKVAVINSQAILESETATQADVDTAIAKIETEINNLTLRSYTVTVNKIADDVIESYNTKVHYGDMFNYEMFLDENETIYKWVMETEDRDVKLNTITPELSQVITGDTTFNCYVDNSSTKAEDTARVVYYDKGNRVIAIDYVTIGSSISHSVEAPKVAFYDFIGWETVSGDPTNVDKSGVSFRAMYTPKNIEANKSTIVALGDVKVNGKQTTTEFYDARIELTGASSYAYCDADGNILQGINGNVIYAPNNSQTIYVCAGTSDKASTSITGVVDEANRLTINAQYYLPSDCTAVEAGIVIAKDNDIPTIGGTGCQALKSNQQGPSGEYSISLKYSTTGTIYAVSYLTYKDSDGTLHTIYSDTQAITYGA